MVRVVASLLAACVVIAGLSACAAGAPSLASDPTPTRPATEPVPAPTRPPSQVTTPEPTDTPSPSPASARPTRAPTATPTPGPTPRPGPPPDPGTGLSQVYHRGTSDRREIALTFDAGADRGYGEQILDTLRVYGVKASFGITGHWAQENPDLVERMVEEGHMVFNHTWSHRSFTGFSTSAWDPGVLTREERLREILDTEEIIRELTGYDTAPYFRPPYGDLDDSALADIAAAGYWITVMWTCDSFGWNGASVAEIISRCADNASPGDIILLHVGGQSLDAEALPGMIESLRDQGYALVTVEEILQP